jgi:flagellar biosynthesis protein FlhA
MRQLLADRLPVADLRRILEGLGQMADRNMPVPAQAEALRPALVPLLLQQMGSISATLKLVTFSPELEQLLMRCKRPAEDGLTLDPDFAGRLLKDLGAAQDAAQAGGHMLMIVVTPTLRRSMAAFLRPNLEDAIVLSLTDLPENRKVEVTQSISLPSALLSSLTPTNGA